MGPKDHAITTCNVIRSRSSQGFFDDAEAGDLSPPNESYSNHEVRFANLRASFRFNFCSHAPPPHPCLSF